MTTMMDAFATPPLVHAPTLELREAAPAMSDERAFETFYRDTAGALRGYVTRVLSSATLADDIVQETYLRVLRAQPALHSPQLRAFLFRVATNLVADHWRRLRRERGSPDTKAAVAQATRPDIPLQMDLARLFERLRPPERAMMWLAYVEGADHEEIARALGVRPRSVRVMLHRTRRKLARWLDDAGRERDVR